VSAARKITQFPIPFPYAQMVTCMLLFHWVMTPITCAALVDNPYWAVVLTFVVVFAFWCINYIGLELEMPFGEDPNDLPLLDMMADLNKSLVELLDERALRVPSFDFDPDVHTTFHPESMGFDDYVAEKIQVHKRRTMVANAVTTSEAPSSDTSCPMPQPLQAKSLNATTSIGESSAIAQTVPAAQGKMRMLGEPVSSAQGKMPESLVTIIELKLSELVRMSSEMVKLNGLMEASTCKIAHTLQLTQIPTSQQPNISSACPLSDGLQLTQNPTFHQPNISPACPLSTPGQSTQSPPPREQPMPTLCSRGKAPELQCSQVALENL